MNSTEGLNKEFVSVLNLYSQILERVLDRGGQSNNWRDGSSSKNEYNGKLELNHVE